MKRFILLLLLVHVLIGTQAAEKRDILQKEAAEIGIEASLVKDFLTSIFQLIKAGTFGMVSLTL